MKSLGSAVILALLFSGCSADQSDSLENGGNSTSTESNPSGLDFTRLPLVEDLVLEQGSVVIVDLARDSEVEMFRATIEPPHAGVQVAFGTASRAFLFVDASAPEGEVTLLDESRQFGVNLPVVARQPVPVALGESKQGLQATTGSALFSFKAPETGWAQFETSHSLALVVGPSGQLIDFPRQLLRDLSAGDLFANPGPRTLTFEVVADSEYFIVVGQPLDEGFGDIPGVASSTIEIAMVPSMNVPGVVKDDFDDERVSVSPGPVLDAGGIVALHVPLADSEYSKFQFVMPPGMENRPLSVAGGGFGVASLLVDYNSGVSVRSSVLDRQNPFDGGVLGAQDTTTFGGNHLFTAVPGRTVGIDVSRFDNDEPAPVETLTLIQLLPEQAP